MLILTKKGNDRKNNLLFIILRTQIKNKYFDGAGDPVYIFFTKIEFYIILVTLKIEIYINVTFKKL